MIDAPPIRRVPVRRERPGGGECAVDSVAEETPVALSFNGISHAVMMATPRDLADLGLGFAISEAIVDSRAECYGIDVRAVSRGFEVALEVSSRAMAALKSRRRALEGRTGCGLCGIESLEAIDLSPVASRPRPASSTMSPDAVTRALTQLPAWQSINADCGGCHAAAWCDPQGRLIAVREDVGRHNALDKLIGHLAATLHPPESGFVLLSSRASFEMVGKCARAGIAAVAAISAPTALAVDVARTAGVALYGFCRGAQVVDYTQQMGSAGPGITSRP